MDCGIFKPHFVVTAFELYYPIMIRLSKSLLFFIEIHNTPTLHTFEEEMETENVKGGGNSMALVRKIP